MNHNVTVSPTNEDAHFSRFETDLMSNLRGLGEEVLAMRQSGGLEIKSKTHIADLVTRADTYVEGELTKLIGAHLPNDGIMGEEGARVESSNGQVWFLDPIDGTMNFARQSHNFGISAGFAKNGVPEFGTVYFPALDQMVSAKAGRGATLKGVTLTCPQHDKELGAFFVGIDFSSHPPTQHELQTFYPAFAASVAYTYRYACATFAVFEVAQGRLDAYVHLNPTIYDYAAIALIAKEAGCFVARNFRGDLLSYEGKASPLVVARTGKVAEMLAPFFKDTAAE